VLERGSLAATLATKPSATHAGASTYITFRVTKALLIGKALSSATAAAGIEPTDIGVLAVPGLHYLPAGAGTADVVFTAEAV
jgi:hypothetical protein